MSDRISNGDAVAESDVAPKDRILVLKIAREEANAARTSASASLEILKTQARKVQTSEEALRLAGMIVDARHAYNNAVERWRAVDEMIYTLS